MDNNAINELLIISSNLSVHFNTIKWYSRKENVNVSRNSGKMDEGGFSIKTGVFNREVSSHSLKRKHESKEVGPGKDGQKAEVTFEDESKEVEPEKDGQKAEVTFEDELEGLEKDDQKAFEEESKGSEKKDNPFIAMDWHAWLERILEFSIEEARINILTYKYTPANGFEEIMIKYIGKVLMDFINKIIDVPSHVMTIDEVERDWIVDKISPMFTYMQATFINKIKFQCQHTNGFRQVVFLEMNGAPTDFLKPHSIGDTYKTLQERIDSLNSMLLNYLNYDVRFAERIRSLTIQGIRDRLTLRTLFLRGKNDYKDEEEFSAVFPLSWDFRFQFIEIFELMEFVIVSVLEYPDVIRELIKHPATSPEFSIRNCISCS
ncbi:unnamed protein product [Rhizophagus irregularis]|uniref:Uncharacterized protein n=2 Tax=Rhizophagus irregularis TaxID=588596 RepID=A0A915ZZH5_9GLOM|nr:unnamed protein product [Rhizophagus irregularis]CAB5396156.1 unnamed protein product [Rhizophagus irregularis]